MVTDSPNRWDPLRTRMFVMLCMLIVSGRAIPSLADDPLDQRVTIPAVVLSVSELAKSITDQSGVPIEVADSVADRRVIVSLPSVKVKEALDSIAQLNDWVWKQEADGRIVLDMSPIRAPKNVDELAAMIPRILPCDVRTYLRIGMNPHNALLSAQDPKLGITRADTALQSQLLQRNQEHLYVEEEQLLASLPQDLPPGKRVGYRDLTAEQRDRVSLILLFNGINNSDHNVIRGEIPEYARRPEDLVLEFHPPHTLFIGVTRKKDGIIILRHRFGAMIPEWRTSIY